MASVNLGPSPQMTPRPSSAASTSSSTQFPFPPGPVQHNSGPSVNPVSPGFASSMSGSGTGPPPTPTTPAAVNSPIQAPIQQPRISEPTKPQMGATALVPLASANSATDK